MKREEYKNEKGQLHRIDGPAYFKGGYREWWFNGKKHRVDGPAIDYVKYYKVWYINNKEIKNTNDYTHEEIFLNYHKI